IDGIPPGQNVLSEDGKTLAAVNGRNAAVAIWDVASKKHVLDLNPGGESIAQLVALSRDGRLAAVTYHLGSSESEKFLTEMQKPPDPKQIRKQAEERDRKRDEDLETLKRGKGKKNAKGEGNSNGNVVLASPDDDDFLSVLAQKYQ